MSASGGRPSGERRSCIAQIKAQGPPRTCNESKEEEQERRSFDGQIDSQMVVNAARRYTGVCVLINIYKLPYKHKLLHILTRWMGEQCGGRPGGERRSSVGHRCT